MRDLALWVAVVALIVLALIAAAGRALALATGAEPFVALYAFLPSPAVEDARLLDRWFAARPWLTWTHILTGSVVLLLAPVQFVPRIRQRFLRYHRGAGRVTLLAALPAGVSGLLLQAQSPYGGALALSAIAAAGVLFLGAGIQAYRAIRRREQAAHREWMIRLLGVGLGVATVRLVALPLILLTGQRPLDLAGEWWIRATRLPY